MKWKHLFITMFVFFMSLSLAGCLQPSSTESNDGPNNTSTEVYNWRMASVWAEGSTLFDYDKTFVDTVNELSNGRLNIKLHSVGELAPADQVLETVSNGTVEIGGDWPNYWSGKNTAFDLLGSQALGLTNWDYLLWINAGGGQELYNEIYGQFNTVYFPHTLFGMESGIRSNKPIESLEDFKGMKIRLAGLIQSRMAEELGAVPTTIAGQEIYESLQRGVIDAAEYSTPSSDDVAKLHEVTDYWLTPGWHQTSSLHGAVINKDAWEQLPDDLKNVVEKASKVTMSMNTATAAYMDAEAAERMVNEYGIITTQLSDEELDEMQTIKMNIVEDLANENPDFKKVLDSQQAFLRMYAPYRDLQGDWGFGNNNNLGQ
ncbi:TRAP transporter substrate-binding protein [Halalkalibacter oceani]|uniref:TRAP transporter substrate-binding protein n=1 Tax=Halalkalibacter oceani TaxID=1653776 RepID=UPI003398BC1E